MFLSPKGIKCFVTNPFKEKTEVKLKSIFLFNPPYLNHLVFIVQACLLEGAASCCFITDLSCKMWLHTDIPPFYTSYILLHYLIWSLQWGNDCICELLHPYYLNVPVTEACGVIILRGKVMPDSFDTHINQYSACAPCTLWVAQPCFKEFKKHSAYSFLHKQGPRGGNF